MKREDKPIRYFVISALILKNGTHEIIEEHGIKGKENTPDHGFNKLKEDIKRKRYTNYPNDTHAINIIAVDEVTKVVYEAKFGR